MRIRLGNGRRGKQDSDETRTRKSLSLLGNQRSLGYKHTEKAKEAMSLSRIDNSNAKGYKHTQKWKDGQSKRSMGNTYASVLKGRKRSIEAIKAIREGVLDYASTLKGQEDYTLRGKQWKERLLTDEKFRKNISTYEKPTFPERKFLEIIHELNLPIRYVGNFSLFISGKNPDFIDEVNKIIFEIQGCYWHKCIECGYGNGDPNFIIREDIYKKEGYFAFEIWEHDLNNNLEKVIFVLSQIYDF